MGIFVTIVKVESRCDKVDIADIKEIIDDYYVY